MPVVPSSYQRQTSGAGLGQVVEQPRANAEVFSGGAAGFTQLGQGMAQLGQGIGRLDAAQQKQLLKETMTRVDADNNKDTIDYNLAQTELRTKTKDSDALNIIGLESRKWLEKRNSERRESLKDNPIGLAYYDRTFSSFASSAIINADSYAASRHKAFTDQTQADKETLAIENAKDLGNPFWMKEINESIGSFVQLNGENDAHKVQLIERARLARRDSYTSKAVRDGYEFPEDVAAMYPNPDAAWGEATNIPEDLQRTLKPEEYKVIQAKATESARAGKEKKRTEFISGIYEPKWQELKGLPINQARYEFYRWVEQFPEQETRSELTIRFNSDISRLEQKQQALDGTLARQAIQYASQQEMSFAEIEQVLLPQLREQGMSLNGQEQFMKQAKQGFDKETEQNRRAYIQTMFDIDDNKIFTLEQLEVAIYLGRLSTRQADELRKNYFPSGGKEGQLRANCTVMNNAIKRYNPELDLEKAPWLFEMVLKELPSGPVTNDNIERAVRTVMRNVRVPGALWGENTMPMYEAERQYKEILRVEIPAEDRRRIEGMLIIAGEQKPTEDQIQEIYDQETRPRIRSLYGR